MSADKPVTFSECLQAAIEHPEFVENFDRLTGHNLSMRGSALDLAIDEATGRTDKACSDFLNCVYECIYLPLARISQAGSGACNTGSL